MEITQHAIDRFIERVAPAMSREDACETMRSANRAVEVAARFGATTVRMGCGAKLILSGERVVTVLARRQINRSRFQGMGG